MPFIKKKNDEDTTDKQSEGIKECVQNKEILFDDLSQVLLIWTPQSRTMT